MAEYKVQIWISDIEVEADNAEEAENKALDLVTNGNVYVWAEYAEVQKKKLDGEWKYFDRKIEVS